MDNEHTQLLCKTVAMHKLGGWTWRELAARSGFSLAALRSAAKDGSLANQIEQFEDELFEEEVQATALSPKFWEIIEKSRQSLRRNGGIPQSALRRSLGLE